MVVTQVIVAGVIGTSAGVAVPPSLKAPDPAPFDYFGDAIAVSGDHLVTSYAARYPALKGKVFSVGIGGVDPIIEGTLASNFYNDGYGTALAAEGDWVVVGAPLRRTTAGTNDLLRGRLHLLKRQANGSLIESSSIAGPAPRSELGAALDIDGGQVVAGLPGVDPTTVPGVDRWGQVRVYTIGTTAMTLTSTIEFPSTTPVRGFGQTVAMSNGWAVASANRFGEPNADAGIVALMQRQTNGTWTLAGTLESPRVIDGDRFGLALAMDGDLLAVGAPAPGQLGDQARGAVYLYRFDGAAWALESELTAPLEVFCKGFGRSIAVEGDEVAVGAVGTLSADADVAAVFTFRRVVQRGEVEWRAEEVRTGLASEDFGSALAFAGARLVIAAPGAGGEIGDAEGAVLLVSFPFADVDGDGLVADGDIAAALDAWGPAPPGEPADLNGDGAVDGADLTMILGKWSKP